MPLASSRSGTVRAGFSDGITLEETRRGWSSQRNREGNHMAVNWSVTIEQVSEPVRAKLEAFASVRAEFEACFAFVEGVHGQRRISPFPVSESVRYLHALWVCERKD